jgi:hypothetical protein
MIEIPSHECLFSFFLFFFFFPYSHLFIQMSHNIRITTSNALSYCSRNLSATWRIKQFSTSSTSLALAKQKLSKKITMPKDPYLLSEKVLKFARNGNLNDAITLVLEAPKSRQSEVVWNNLIQESSKLGKTNQAWQLLTSVKSFFIFIFIFINIYIYIYIYMCVCVFRLLNFINMFLYYNR